ncbi:MAG: PHP domain-containing protein [Tissierella sp.]|uniref:PHP domain-containing protein n=1 Tax=Tissierella sp. TaxID=41274 RepID=UPI003F95021A
MKFDLHVHTNYSDGKFTPNKVIDLSIERNLNGIAITDHDTVDGIEEAIEYSKQYKNFKIIPGIELGCLYNGEEVHILGYFINYKSKEILNATRLLKSNRIQRGKKIIEKLRKLNIDINVDEVQNLSKKDFVGRANITRTLVNKNYVSSVYEAFDKYLNMNAKAYVERKALSINESINLIHKADGVAILAHPGILKNKETIINYCIKKGIQGIECIQSKHSQKDVDFFKAFSHENNLLITGGSDFHGDKIGKELLLGKYFVGEYEVSRIKELI